MTEAPPLPVSLRMRPDIALCDQTEAQLREELAYWEAKRDDLEKWGAAAGYAVKFATAYEQELRRRRLQP